jgi:Holliday junction resolvasome RuvABC DNA-binding subunit
MLCGLVVALLLFGFTTEIGSERSLFLASSSFVNVGGVFGLAILSDTLIAICGLTLDIND